jgi:hypothetical protein
MKTKNSEYIGNLDRMYYIIYNNYSEMCVMISICLKNFRRKPYNQIKYKRKMFYSIYKNINYIILGQVFANSKRYQIINFKLIGGCILGWVVFWGGGFKYKSI